MARSIYVRDVGAARPVITGPCRLIRILVSSTVESNCFVGVYDARSSVLLGSTPPGIGFVVGPSTGLTESMDIGVDMDNGIVVGAATANGGATAISTGLDLTFIVEDC